MSILECGRENGILLNVSDVVFGGPKGFDQLISNVI